MLYVCVCDVGHSSHHQSSAENENAGTESHNAACWNERTDERRKCFFALSSLASIGRSTQWCGGNLAGYSVHLKCGSRHLNEVSCFIETGLWFFGEKFPSRLVSFSSSSIIIEHICLRNICGCPTIHLMLTINESHLFSWTTLKWTWAKEKATHTL